MSKLLTEPRVPKITEIKKRVPRKKKSPDTKVKYTLLRETDKTQVKELIRIYKEDPLKARVKAYNAKTAYSFDRLVLFEYSNDEFEISYLEVNFGISITNKMYSTQRKACSILYRKGKLYSIKRERKKAPEIRPLLFKELKRIIQVYENVHRIDESQIFNFMYTKFPFIKMLHEKNEISANVNLNVVKTKKLFGGKDINRYMFKVPNNIVEMLLKSNLYTKLQSEYGGAGAIKSWIEMLKILDGVENITPELLNASVFKDTCRMAKTLGRRVNCRWGIKRLTEEHDMWAKEITNIILDCEIEYDLNIRPVFIEFARFSGYHLLKTNKDLLREGMLQKHCVGTYINDVDSGRSAIYHVDGYTLQVQIRIKSKQNERFEILANGIIPYSMNPELHNAQFRGKLNNAPPQELVDRVNRMLNGFNVSDGFERSKKEDMEFKAGSIKSKTYLNINPVERRQIANALNDFEIDF